jgi:hypothetical protein
MPIHDWTRVDAGLCHDFHQSWTSTLCDHLNRSGLPSDHFALIEKPIRKPMAEFLKLQLSPKEDEPVSGPNPLTVATVPPRTRVTRRKKEVDLYAEKANRIVVRHQHGDVIAVIEIVSPGNKGSKSEFRAFVEKSVD